MLMLISNNTKISLNINSHNSFFNDKIPDNIKELVRNSNIKI